MIHELSVFSYCFAIKKILEFYVRHYLGGTFSLFLLLPCTFLFFGFISNSFSLLFLSVFSYCFENRPVNSCMINSTGNNFQSFLIASLQISITETKALKRSAKGISSAYTRNMHVSGITSTNSSSEAIRKD